jgi:hypothetical protein
MDTTMSDNDIAGNQSRTSTEATELSSKIAETAPFARFDARATLAGRYDDLRAGEVSDDE